MSKRILFDILVFVTIIATAIYVYQTYGDQIVATFVGEQPALMYVKGLPIKVSIADEPAEHKQGLSGVKSLGEFEGKLFIYSKEGDYRMWMKDMFIPLDIIWINNDMKIVHIEENLTPDTYPDVFGSPVPARFVLEVNAFFAKNASIQIGDSVLIPSTSIPKDLIKLQ